MDAGNNTTQRIHIFQSVRHVSIGKQIAYAEFAEQKGFAEGNKIFNVFLLPHGCETICENAIPYNMNFLGTAVADWKDGSKPHHKIIGIQLDVKSVMRNYSRNESAQSELAKIVKNAWNKEKRNIYTNERESIFLEFSIPQSRISAS